MSKATHSQDRNLVDNIPACRYISHMKQNGKRPPKAAANYIGKFGILFRADCLDLLAKRRVIAHGRLSFIF